MLKINSSDLLLETDMTKKMIKLPHKYQEYFLKIVFKITI